MSPVKIVRREEIVDSGIECSVWRRLISLEGVRTTNGYCEL